MAESPTQSQSQSTFNPLALLSPLLGSAVVIAIVNADAVAWAAAFFGAGAGALLAFGFMPPRVKFAREVGYLISMTGGAMLTYVIVVKEYPGMDVNDSFRWALIGLGVGVVAMFIIVAVINNVFFPASVTNEKDIQPVAQQTQPQAVATQAFEPSGLAGSPPPPPPPAHIRPA